MAKIFLETDADLEPLADLSIGVIGYGNQGRAHALNLRDSGLSVHVATREGSPARVSSQKDGFAANSVAELADNCQALAIMLPDEIIPAVYSESIEPYVKPHDIFIFAHGFAVHHQSIRLPDDADIVLVAPTGPGRQLRSLFQDGKGLPALVAVEQDASGLAWKRCLSYAMAIGSLRAGAIETTFAEETIVDLYCEQAVLCGGLPQLIKTSFDVLVERGYQPELAYISCLKEVKLIADLLFEKGMDGMRSAISNTAKFGAALSGPELVNAGTERRLSNALERIESGQFAQLFQEEFEQGRPRTKNLLLEEAHSRLASTGRQLRGQLDF